MIRNPPDLEELNQKWDASDVVVNATSKQGTIEDAQQILGIVPGRAPFMD